MNDINVVINDNNTVTLSYGMFITETIPLAEFEAFISRMNALIAAHVKS